MSDMLVEPLIIVEAPDIENLVTEDDTPVDNIFSAKQARLLVEPLYSSWKPGRPFLADANVGIFRSVYLPPVVPDMFLSLDVEADEDWWKKENRSYFLWKHGKPPEVVVEIVSNTRGGELDQKLREYALVGTPYYVVFDPQQLIQAELLRVHGLHFGRYKPIRGTRLDEVGLSLVLWEGGFEGGRAIWLRWCDLDGNLIPTGAERAEQEWQRAEQERARAERLAARLRELGVEAE